MHCAIQNGKTPMKNQYGKFTLPQTFYSVNKQINQIIFLFITIRSVFMWHTDNEDIN